ncbi:MAG: ABC-F family ATP-binding cassette domain-containing protein, partial [Deltaproteobacteria bacterium]|nr:ABC-F family ATP-binding cassette domain-containing protein [Deltaproteobacteria bacterium]
MALISLRNITVGFSGPPVLDDVELTIERGERVSMVGRNGQGKSTLMKVITGTLTQDSGQIAVEDGAKIAYLPQDVPQGIA